MSKILLVDDDADLAELIKTKLSAEGHQPYVINTGEGAFEYAKQVKPDICILDIMLPGATGYEICRKMRRDPVLYKLAVLLLTALGEEPEILHGLEQGADDYLVKPFKLERLMDKIESLSALLTAISSPSRITNLPGTEAIKREVNHQLARDTAVALAYIDMVGFKPFCASRGTNGQAQALKFMSDLLVTATRNMGIYESYVAHMGSEHFAVLLKFEDQERFCNGVIESFDHKVKDLYTQQELDQGYFMAVDNRNQEVRCPLMALSIGVCHTQYRKFKNVKKMLEVLAQIRRKAQPENGKSVVLVDRRHSDR